MKLLLKFILFQALLLSCAVASAQTIIPPGKLATEEYVQKYVKAYLDSVQGKRPDKPTTDKPADDPDNDFRIISVVQKGNELEFDLYSRHAGVQPYTVTIRKGNDVWTYRDQRQELFQPYRLQNLPTTGAVEITIQSVARGWKVTQTVTIKPWETGSTDRPTGPDVVNPPNGPTGKKKVHILSQGYDYVINLQFRDSADVWLITDQGTLKPSPGYEYRYFVGGQEIRTKQRLKNYVWGGDHPGRVVLVIVKEGLDTLARWTLNPNEKGWFDHNAGQYFGHGETGGFVSWVITG
ncbi:hypothetical protein [Telluribacter humicola]|uniref:hypothetical protein n=1 Tax=Telluribacter humicola TaxID=1720261 RepID=UPI001A95F77B|nr:hypothetical protein [Telluribacter humicola]